MIENQLLQHLMADDALRKMLAIHNGKPAVFEQVVPPDNHEGWDGKQFSRIVFDINTEESPTRKATGTLSVDIECTDSSTQFDEISPVLKAAIDGYFFASDEGTAVAARWLSTDNFTTDETHKIFGCTQTYDLYAFPVQTVGDSMDPVALVNSETKKLLPESKIIAVDGLDDAWAPTDEAPAVYWRLSDVRSDPVMSKSRQLGCFMVSGNACWDMLFAPTQMRRNGLVKALGEASMPRAAASFSRMAPHFASAICGLTLEQTL
jgi:hypothetical protein